MADTVVSFLLENLTQLLQQEVKLLAGVEDKVRSLQKELEMIKAFLKDSEGKRNEHETVKVVVSQIRDVAHEAQDVIDNYIVNADEQKRRSKLGKAVRSFDHARMLQDVNNKIDSIKTTIRDIYNNKDRYHIKEGDSGKAEPDAAESLHKLRGDVEKVEVVGFDQYSTEVIKQLEGGDLSLDVISIVGMAGLGKTTLAWKVYKHYQANKHFDCRAWAYVSNEYRPRDLLVSLLRCLMPRARAKLHRLKSDKESTKTEVLDQLKIMVQECLANKKYFIVLDDVWKTQVWNEVKEAFPDDNKGSRILITSRLKEVASHVSETEPYCIQPLSPEDSWKLFSKIVFQGGECPSNLESLGKEIVASCKGLPLSIVVLAGLLRNKERSERVWSKNIKGNVKWYLNQEETRIKDILRLSYDSLPPRLKPCFLILGIYPEDTEIPVRQLIQLWIAEGFIEQTDNRIPEDVAEDYLQELINRSLVQVASRRTDGGVKTCRLHDLLRELCISVGQQEKFLQVHTDVTREGKPRRLSVHCAMPNYISESACDYSSTRSLFCFSEDVDRYNFESTHEKWLKGFKLVRVLDLGRVGLSSIPEKLGKLIHLRYLKINTGSSSSLPDSICDLWNLETLDLRGSKIQSLSKKMWKLKRLRHLYVFGEVALPEFTESENSKMSNLQTFSTVALNPNTVAHLEKGKFPNVKKLGFDTQSQETTPLELLQRLQCLSQLEAVKIFYPKGFATSAKGFPPNITKVTLVKVDGLSEKGMNTLGSLPNLRILKLSGLENASMFVLYCAAEGFQQLRVLQITGLACERWELKEGAMPRLQRLVINKCECLTGLPDELWSLDAIKEVKILWPTREIVRKLHNLNVTTSCKLTIYPLAGEDRCCSMISSVRFAPYLHLC